MKLTGHKAKWKDTSLSPEAALPLPLSVCYVSP